MATSKKTGSGYTKVTPKKDTMAKNIGAAERMGKTPRQVGVKKSGGKSK